MHKVNNFKTIQFGPLDYTNLYPHTNSKSLLLFLFFN